MSKYIQRKEIAQAVEVHPDTVAANEKRWGLVRIAGFRQARYIRNDVKEKLAKRGIALESTP